ncbi:DUF1638 domain-containing protein [Oricola sp.]|uniref:DUF1638 domain-containing protein n=1 Tax=Oricola sp. TaxID=1979950 RepID=UPI003BA91B05
MTVEPEKVRVIACGMIAREILDICRANGLDHISLTCLPADFHHHPHKIAPAAEAAILKAKKDGYSNIFMGYADCGTGGMLDEVCERHGVDRIAGPHCFSFYFGNAEFAATDDEFLTTFFMTDFLARHFDTFLMRPLGLDRHPELREMYFGNYDRLLYLAQTAEPELAEKARKAASALGLRYEHKYTGYGDLTPALKTAGTAAKTPQS